MTASGKSAPGPLLYTATILVTAAATILFAATVLTVVDGLEWSILSLLGVGLLPTEILLGLTTLPLLYVIWWFAGQVWRTERTLLEAAKSGEDGSASGG